jgi:hypothetical protein
MHATCSTIVVDLVFAEVKMLSNFNEVDKGVGDEMNHLIEAIMSTCSFAEIT